MKQYQITFNVPDDFNPDEMELNVSYKDDITIFSESFENIEERIQNFIENNVVIEKQSIKDNDVIIFKCSKDVLGMDPQDVLAYMNRIKCTLEIEFNCPVVGYIDDIDVLIENADQAIDMFNGMIAKIKVRSAVKDTSRIILPS